MATILVTGGAGFIGSVLTQHLLDGGHGVRVLDNLMYGGGPLLSFWRRDDVKLVIGDLCDSDARSRALEGVDSVVHLAGIVGDPASKRDPELGWRVNFDATRDLIDDAVAAGVKRFVFASTCSNYGVSAPDALVDEESTLNPISSYAEAKVKSEQMLMDAAKKGLDPIVLRLSTVYGVSPRMRFDLLVNDFTREAFARKKIVIYGEQFWRPHIHVFDVARAMRHVLELPEDPGRPRVFNVGEESENYQKEALANVIVEEVPGTELEFVKRDEDPRSYRVAFKRIKEYLGYETTMTIRDGTREILRLLEDGLVVDYDDKKYVN